MHYNLLIKKQRKLFWNDCKKAIYTCAMPEDIDLLQFTWEEGRHLTPIEMLDFWDTHEIVNNDSNFGENLSQNAFDTFEYYDGEGIEELYGYEDEE